MKQWKRAVIIGRNGGVGRALLEQLSQHCDTIYTLSRSLVSDLLDNETAFRVNIANETEIESACNGIPGELDLVIVATGILHDGEIQPEKALSQLDPTHIESVFRANLVGPAIVMKHLVPKLSSGHPSVFAALSARVGSISDNRLGGWYSYRASKAALNMMIKTAAIETKRRNKNAAIIGLHPGTVVSGLSAPFIKNVPEDKQFSPAFSAEKLITVIENVTPADSGQCFAWDGSIIPA